MIENQFSLFGRTAHIIQMNANIAEGGRILPNSNRSLEIRPHMIQKIPSNHLDTILSVITLGKTTLVYVYKNRDCTIHDEYELKYKENTSRKFIVNRHDSILKELNNKTVPKLDWTTKRSSMTSGGSMNLMFPYIHIPDTALCVQKVLKEIEKDHAPVVQSLSFQKKQN